MIVVSDTTPLRYLIEIDQVHIIAALFGTVFIPEKVAAELQHAKTPQKVKDWMQARPAWLEVRTADLSLFTPLRQLHAGEREAFALALELQAQAVLLDDRKAMPEAHRLKLQTIALFTLLEIAATRNLLDLPLAVDAMRQTTFRLPPEPAIQAMLARDAARQQAQKTPESEQESLS